MLTLLDIQTLQKSRGLVNTEGFGHSHIRVLWPVRCAWSATSTVQAEGSMS